MTVEEIIAQAIAAMPTTILELYDRPGGPPGNGYRPLGTGEKAASIVAAIDAAGYVVVPKEPADAMIEAVEKAGCDNTEETYVTEVGARQAYRAMIEARPK